jgi:hypothetical protein
MGGAARLKPCPSTVVHADIFEIELPALSQKAHKDGAAGKAFYRHVSNFLIFDREARSSSKWTQAEPEDASRLPEIVIESAFRPRAR